MIAEMAKTTADLEIFRFDGRQLLRKMQLMQPTVNEDVWLKAAKIAEGRKPRRVKESFGGALSILGRPSVNQDRDPAKKMSCRQHAAIRRRLISSARGR